VTDGADRTTSLVYVGGKPHLRLGPGQWVIEVRVDHQHRYKQVTSVEVGEQGLLYPVPGETDDIRAKRIQTDLWTEEFMRGVTPI